MRTLRFLPLCLLLLTSCREDLNQLPDGICERIDLKGSGPGDMSPPAPKCAAAKGLSGDNLLCVDFTSLSDQTLTTPLPQNLVGWSFGKDSMNNDCWQILSGKLQVIKFSNFMSTCNFLLPALSANDYQKYNSFTLSLVQTVDLTPKQGVSAYLGVAVPVQQIWFTTGNNPRQIATIDVAKASLPNGGSGTYQLLFQIVSTLGGGATGWQIESIAVNGRL